MFGTMTSSPFGRIARLERFADCSHSLSRFPPGGAAEHALDPVAAAGGDARVRQAAQQVGAVDQPADEEVADRHLRIREATRNSASERDLVLGTRNTGHEPDELLGAASTMRRRVLAQTPSNASGLY